MSTAPDFFFRATFPFCPITRTTAEIDDIVTNGYGTTPGAYTYAGRVDGLTLREAWQLYWLKETASFNITVDGDSYGTSPNHACSLSGAFPAVGNKPSFRACKTVIGSFSATSTIPPSPVDDDTYCTAMGNWEIDVGDGITDTSATPIILDSTTETYTVLFNVRMTTTVYIYSGGSWLFWGERVYASDNTGVDSGTLVNLFGGDIRIYNYGTSGTAPTVTISDFTAEGDFTIP